MEVLGIDPVHRLVVPRVLATVFVAVMINGIVIAAGIGGGYFFTVIVQGGSAGAFLSSFTALASLPDLYISMIKAVLFGYLAAITHRIELMTGVIILPQRQTALVAKQATEVDVLSGGRLRLGIGVGWNAVEFEGMARTSTTAASGASSRSRSCVPSGPSRS